MQPTQLALVIHKGATFRARLRVMQPTPVYRDITAIIAAAPVRLTVDHGLPTDWPIWIERVRQLPGLNRVLNQEKPHFAKVVDAATDRCHCRADPLSQGRGCGHLARDRGCGWLGGCVADG